MEAIPMKRIGIISTAVLSLALGASATAFAQQEQHDQQEESKAKAAQDEKKAQPKNAKQQENARQNEKNPPQQEHSQQAKPVQQEQHANNRGGRIPEDRYKANFGNDHRFRVTHGDYSNRRFQYGGYWFGFEGSWPSNWLYTQDVYVIEINGMYYLCNANYPGVNIALSVTL
jgi:hypothetical protein